MGLSRHKCLNPPESERRMMDSDSSAEITHLARKPMPYAFSCMLKVFKHFRILFIAYCMTHIPRYVYLGIGVIMGNVIKSARNKHIASLRIKWRLVLHTISGVLIGASCIRINSLIASWCPPAAAWCNGVCRSLSSLSGDAPAWHI